MAAPVPTDKVKDKEYSNWLKVTLALYYMKSGLHTFVQSEVDCLHKFLVQKIYGGITVPLPPCTTCHARFVRRNKYNGIWTFQKACKSYCHVWLYEMLKLHTNPNSEKIYWDNSHVASWPFNPWECAKVFMPRGQLPSSVGPAECDAQAMLTLLANCTHFHQKLSPQGLGLTHAISIIRNKVMHDGDMKLSDADRLTFIQKITQLLEDPVCLQSIEDCKAAVGNIQKIDNDSLDVLFNLDIEMTGLRSAVNEFRWELGLQEKRTLDTADSLKEEYEQLRQQLTERFADVENRLETIERDVKEQQEKYQEMHRARLDKVEENVHVIPKQRRNRKGKGKTAGKRISEYGTSVTPVKRRPESDVLRQLKNTPMKIRPDSNALRLFKKTSSKQRHGSDRLRQVKKPSVTCNYTIKELLDAWPSIEEYLLEELAPKNLLTFFKEENLLSAEECRTMCLLSRSQAAEMLLQCMQAKLPESFSCLSHALNETKQEAIVLGLRQKIEIQKLLTMTHNQEANQLTPNMACYTLKLELLKDGNTVHDTEMKTRGYFDRGRIVFQYDLRSESLKWEQGSVIVHLRPLRRQTKETLAFFCKHGGMKDFVLDLLKKKDIFASLPEGEMTIHIQVCCYDKESEDADGQHRDVTQMAEKDVLSAHDSFTVTDDLQMIRQNLLLQYGYLLEEIEPLQFQDTFVVEGIWDTSVFKELRTVNKRRARAADFLNKVLDKGSAALAALVLALKNSGNDNIADRLCIILEASAQFRDEGQIDGSIEVVQEELTTDDQEHVLWSCHLNVEVNKNEDDGSTKSDMPSVPDQGEKVVGQPEMKSPPGTYSYQEPSNKSFIHLTVLELCERLKLCGLDQLIEVCTNEKLDGKFMYGLDERLLRESPFNLTEYQIRKYHDMVYKNWALKKDIVGHHETKRTVASSIKLSLTPSTETEPRIYDNPYLSNVDLHTEKSPSVIYSYQEPQFKNFRHLTVSELCERSKLCGLEQLMECCKIEVLDGEFMYGLEEEFLVKSPFNLTEFQIRKYHYMVYKNWVPKLS